jgi:hypothetical protein
MSLIKKLLIATIAGACAAAFNYLYELAGHHHAQGMLVFFSLAAVLAYAMKTNKGGC